MPKTSEMRESKFLKKEDVGRGVLVTINGCLQKNVAQPGADPDHKWCLTFDEVDKPFVLNATNVQLCEQICGSDDTDDWMGKQIVLYTDDTIMYAGKVVGGIRVRRPKPNGTGVKPAPKPKPTLPEADLDEDPIPF